MPLFGCCCVDWSERQLQTVLKMLLVSSLVVVLYGFYQFIIQDYGGLFYVLYPGQEEYIAPWSGRITSFLNNSNPFAAYLNLVLPFAISLSFACNKSGLRLAARLFLGLGSIALLLTQSRGGLAAFLSILFLAVWFYRTGKHVRKRAVMLLVIGLVVVLPVLGMLSERFGAVDEVTAAGRLVMYSTATEMFLSAPILGVGYGNFSDVYDHLTSGSSLKSWVRNWCLRALAPTHIISHLQLLAKQAPSALFCSSLSSLSYCEWVSGSPAIPDPTIERQIGFGVFAAVVGLLVHGLVDDSFVVMQFSALFWLDSRFARGNRAAVAFRAGGHCGRDGVLRAFEAGFDRTVSETDKVRSPSKFLTVAFLTMIWVSWALFNKPSATVPAQIDAGTTDANRI